MDLKTTFLNKDLEKEIHMELSKSYKVLGKENKVYKMRKSLYDMK